MPVRSLPFPRPVKAGEQNSSSRAAGEPQGLEEIAGETEEEEGWCRRAATAPSVVTLTLVSHVSTAHRGLLPPGCGEKGGLRGRFRESELVEAPPHRAEIWFSLGARCPLPASGARKAAPLGNRSKCSRRHTNLVECKIQIRRERSEQKAGV